MYAQASKDHHFLAIRIRSIFLFSLTLIQLSEMCLYNSCCTYCSTKKLTFSLVDKVWREKCARAHESYFWMLLLSVYRRFATDRSLCCVPASMGKSYPSRNIWLCSELLLFAGTGISYIRETAIDTMTIANHSSQWVAYPSFICVLLINI